MIKKIVLSLFIIGSMAILMYGLTGSGAWFTDSASTTGAISSGNFDLEVSGGPLDYSGLEPGAGYQKIGEFCVQNNGDFDMKFRGHMKDVDDPGNLRDYLFIKIVLKHLNDDDENNYGPEEENTIIGSDIPFGDLMDWNDYILLSPEGADHPEPFSSGSKACYILSAKLTSDAGNEQIQQTLSAELYLNATQWINSGW